MREKVTFNLRSPFPELESICYLFNKMMISGKGNHAELKIGKSKEKDIDYITINVYRCRKYPSVTVNRDVDLIDFETENFVSSVDFSKSILFFEADSTGKFITVYICNSYNDLPDNKCRLAKFPPVKFNNSSPLLDVKFELRKPFDEIAYFANIINSMLASRVRSHISVSSDNHFSIAFLYSDLDRPSLKLEIGLIKGSFPKKNAYILSEYNISCSRDIPLNSSFSVFRSNDVNYGQVIHIYVYKPKDKKLLDELTRQFALFAI